MSEQAELFGANDPPAKHSRRLSAGDRALAHLAGEAVRLEDTIVKMQRLAAALPLTIQIEVNNLMEVNDFLRHKLHEEVLSRAIHTPTTGG